MIPRALPRLVTDALTNRWTVGARHVGTSLFATFMSPDGDLVEFQWHNGRIVTASINDDPTPYTQCTRLVRANTEGATS